MQTESSSPVSREHSGSTSPGGPALSPPGPGAQYFAAGLFVLLAAFTSTVIDNSEICTHWIGAGLFLLLAAWMVLGFQHRIHWCVPSVCLLLMASYGVAQTIWSPYKILSEGWRITIFWWACAGICLLAHQLFHDLALARHFRLAFVYFASLICLLDLVQQASHTNKVLWIFPSGWPFVYGTFQYANNFCQFVELSLPVTLWLGFSQRRTNFLMLLLAALQVSAVIASSSRAGTILVITEFLVVLLVSWYRGRSRLPLPMLGIVVALTFGLVAVAGFDRVVERLKSPDQLAVRRQINEASIDMIKAHPWIGWGLGTYVPVYPRFARYDDGTYVNHAHNDWLEWSAEGGVFFAGLMLVVFLWTLRPAWRSVWGIGVIFVCVNALVDYPFARLAVCGWYFALVGMLAGHREEKRSRHRHRRRTGENGDQTEFIPGNEQRELGGSQPNASAVG
jgi:O-antigen ligase